MGKLVLLLAIALAGALSALQPSINARLSQKVGVLPSAAVSFSVGAAALLALVLLGGRGGGFRGLGQASWWEFTGGLIGAVYVTATIVVVPRLGTAAAMAAVIAAQLSAGLVLDHVGAFGLREIAVDWRRLLGVGLLLAGAALVYRQ